MNDKNSLLDRMYVNKQAKQKPARYLRPKNPAHIAPSLTTRPTEKDNPPVPEIKIPSDLTSRPYSAMGTDHYGTSTFSVRRPQEPITSRPLTSLNETPSITPRTERARPATAFADYPRSNLQSELTTPRTKPIPEAIPRGKPPQLVPIEVRPATSFGRTNSSRMTPNTTRPGTSFQTARDNYNFSGKDTQRIQTQRQGIQTERPTTKTDQTSNQPVFRLKKSNLSARSALNLEEFRQDPLYSPEIPDELWRDRSLIFYYIILMRQNHLKDEFLYFESERATSRENENVYFLHVISPSEVNWDYYYTLSSLGVTTYYKTKGEFTNLQQWLRECEIFIKIKKIAFF